MHCLSAAGVARASSRPLRRSVAVARARSSPLAQPRVRARDQRGPWQPDRAEIASDPSTTGGQGRNTACGQAEGDDARTSRQTRSGRSRMLACAEPDPAAHARADVQGVRERAPADVVPIPRAPPLRAVRNAAAGGRPQRCAPTAAHPPSCRPSRSVCHGAASMRPGRNNLTRTVRLVASLRDAGLTAAETATIAGVAAGAQRRPVFLPSAIGPAAHLKIVDQ